MTEAYFIGREHVRLVPPFQYKDKLFGGERLDGLQICDGLFLHCSFANIGLKEATLHNNTFVNCTFIGCYFRRATLKNCQFTGCRFIDCDFSYISISGCQFKYTKFRRCIIPQSVLQLNLPAEPNLREDLCRNLALEAASLGYMFDAHAYRLEEINAREENWKFAVLGSTDWYRSHYDILRRIGAGLRLASSLLNRILWGYGERVWTLFRNFLIVTFVIFPLVFWRYEAELLTTPVRQITAPDFVFFSLDNIIPGGVTSGIIPISTTVRMIAAVESVFGVVLVGLFVSYLLRWILRR